MALSNFGEQFAAKTLRRFYAAALTPAITNSNYEGDIKKAEKLMKELVDAAKKAGKAR